MLLRREVPRVARRVLDYSLSSRASNYCGALLYRRIPVVSYMVINRGSRYLLRAYAPALLRRRGFYVPDDDIPVLCEVTVKRQYPDAGVVRDLAYRIRCYLRDIPASGDIQSDEQGP